MKFHSKKEEEEKKSLGGNISPPGGRGLFQDSSSHIHRLQSLTMM